MLYVCVRGVIDVLFSVCIVTRGAVGARVCEVRVFRHVDVVCLYLVYILWQIHVAPIAQLVSALDLVTSSVQVEGSILTAGKRLSLKNLNVIIRAIN